jgi:hypothetical protein
VNRLSTGSRLSRSSTTVRDHRNAVRDDGSESCPRCVGIRTGGSAATVPDWWRKNRTPSWNLAGRARPCGNSRRGGHRWRPVKTARSSSTCALRRTGPDLLLAILDHCACSPPVERERDARYAPPLATARTSRTKERMRGMFSSLALNHRINRKFQIAWNSSDPPTLKRRALMLRRAP